MVTAGFNPSTLKALFKNGKQCTSCCGAGKITACGCTNLPTNLILTLSGVDYDRCLHYGQYPWWYYGKASGINPFFNDIPFNFSFDYYYDGALYYSFRDVITPVAFSHCSNQNCDYCSIVSNLDTRRGTIEIHCPNGTHTQIRVILDIFQVNLDSLPFGCNFNYPAGDHPNCTWSGMIGPYNNEYIGGGSGIITFP